jgi:hypothetical protein
MASITDGMSAHAAERTKRSKIFVVVEHDRAAMRDGNRHAAVERDGHPPAAGGGRIRDLQPTRLREDCVDLAGRSCRTDRLDLCHETRVATTDAAAGAKFRRYWSCFSPGIVLIRWLLLP